MNGLYAIQVESDDLQSSAWPPIFPFRAFPEGLNGFLLVPLQEQARFLVALRSNAPRHAQFLQEGLACLYAYQFGYRDSPIYLITPDALERRLLSAKIILEREMLNHWLRPEAPPDLGNTQETVHYLEGLIDHNRCTDHGFVGYMRNEMPLQSLLDFLRFDTLNPETAADDTALTIIGLQNLMKKAIVSDLLETTGSPLSMGGVMPGLSASLAELFPDKEEECEPPWFCRIVSNSFRMLATRPGWKFRAYGAYLLNESQAIHHYHSLLRGLARSGCAHRNLFTRFASKERFHRDHQKEMLSALLHQRPRLSSDELWEVGWGAHIAIASTCKFYDQARIYFQRAAGARERSRTR